MLQDAGFRTASVLNGEQALDFLSREKADLILMDVHMPGMDGFNATREIRCLESEARNIPIVAITAHALPGDRDKCIDAGMNDYISKPFQPAELVKKIDNWLGISDKIKADTDSEVEVNILDRDNLEKISLGNKEFLKDLLLTYVVDVEQRLKNLSTSFISNDIKSVILESHSIKGASLSIGANKVGDEAKAIEISGKNDNIIEAEEKYYDLVQAFKETKKHIFDYLG